MVKIEISGELKELIDASMMENQTYDGFIRAMFIVLIAYHKERMDKYGNSPPLISKAHIEEYKKVLQ